VVVVEGGGDGAAALAGGAEGHALGWDGGVGVEGVVGGDEAGDVDQIDGEGEMAGLVWRLDCYGGAHALVCLVVVVGRCRFMGHYMGCRLWVEIGRIRERRSGFENDTEVAAKNACVLKVIGLKREGSRFFSRWNDRRGSPALSGDVHRRGWIVIGSLKVGLVCRSRVFGLREMAHL
jgi:hypothetical protein